MQTVGNLLLLAIAAWVYFIPAIIAYDKRHINAAAVLITNTFLGWTILGWVAALIWATMKTQQRRD